MIGIDFLEHRQQFEAVDAAACSHISSTTSRRAAASHGVERLVTVARGAHLMAIVFRMPETRSRISASSSMMRMSTPLRDSCALFCACVRSALRRVLEERTARPRRARTRRIVQLNEPPMVFHHARDDSQAQPGALRARGDIRFDQAIAILLAESPSRCRSLRTARRTQDRATATDEAVLRLAIAGAARLHAFSAVLHEIKQRLRDQALIAHQPNRTIDAFGFKANIGEGDSAAQTPRTRAISLMIGERHARRRHASERREFIDHASNIGDLAQDRVGAFLEGFAVGGDLAGVFSRRRSAESWIGVSGFLISCAMRRATSFHASWRCAEMSLVMSSKVSTNPPSASGSCARSD